MRIPLIISFAAILSAVSLLSDIYAGESAAVIKSKDIAVYLSSSGEITGIKLLKKGDFWKVNFKSIIGNCKNNSEAIFHKEKNGEISIEKHLFRKEDNFPVVLKENFKPGAESIRWEMEIESAGDPWNTEIETYLKSDPAKNLKFWTAWSDPACKNTAEREDHLSFLSGTKEYSWNDPLVPQKFSDTVLYYGAPAYRFEKPGLYYCPFRKDVFCIPIAVLVDEKNDTAVSIILSPEDDILDMEMYIDKEGIIRFDRLFNRLGEKRKVRFAMDIITHEGDWRPTMKWMTERYVEYFSPALENARYISGTGAYSCNWAEFDAEKMKQMAFSVNWKASFDFPYMGMFIPPVKNDEEEWLSFKKEMVSIKKMREYSKIMKDFRFNVLNYFNVFEFGAHLTFPPSESNTNITPSIWKNPEDYTFGLLKNAIVTVPQDEIPTNGIKPGGPYWSWEGSILLDPGEPVYKNFLIEQAKRHIEKLPESSGICIDRLDWCRLYNFAKDDSLCWLYGRSARPLLFSWKSVSQDICRLMHESGKVVFVNNHDKRLDILKNIDGIFDEFTYDGCPLNLTAFLCLEKPAIGWTADESNLKPDPDRFFQKYLYMGVFPMAPFPGNDHSLGPSDWVDRQYLDYGPLLNAMKGRKWVLEPHIVRTENGKAKVNIFEVPEGYALPVVFAENSVHEKIFIRNFKNVAGNRNYSAMAFLPGEKKPLKVNMKKNGKDLIIETPLKRGCAMVVLK